VKITLVDISGKEIAEVSGGIENAGMFTKTFSTGHLPKGIYLLNVSVDGKNTAKRIIIE